MIASLSLAVVIGVVALRHPGNGLVVWALALCCHVAAYACAAMHHLPAAVVVANVLLTVTFALAGEALCRLQRRPPPRWLLWLPVIVAAPGFAALASNPLGRAMLATPLLSAQALTLLVLLWQRRQHSTGHGQYVLAIGLALLLPVYAVRFAAALRASSELLQVTAPGAIQSLTFVVSITSTILCTLGFVLMTHEHSADGQKRLAMLDELTGLPNRRSTLQWLTHMLAGSKRSQRPLSVLMVDIDHFKEVNDRYGHLAGDQVLRHVAQVLRARLRDQDLVGRYGGEEFLALLPDTQPDRAGEGLAEELRAAVAREHFSVDAHTRLTVTISIGAAGLQMPGDMAAAVLVAAADLALYRAKDRGRNNVQVAGSQEYRAASDAASSITDATGFRLAAHDRG